MRYFVPLTMATRRAQEIVGSLMDRGIEVHWKMTRLGYRAVRMTVVMTNADRYTFEVHGTFSRGEMKNGRAFERLLKRVGDRRERRRILNELAPLTPTIQNELRRAVTEYDDWTGLAPGQAYKIISLDGHLKLDKECVEKTRAVGVSFNVEATIEDGRLVDFARKPYVTSMVNNAPIRGGNTDRVFIDDAALRPARSVRVF